MRTWCLGFLTRDDQRLPARQVALVARQVEQLEQHLVEALAGEHQRHFVDRRHVARRDHVLGRDVAEERDLLPHGLRAAARSTRQRSTSAWMPISRSSRTECWVGLVLSSSAAAMYGTSVRWTLTALFAPELEAELADGLEEGQRLDVAHRAADLDDHHVVAVGEPRHRFLDLVGDVRDDLHGLAEVVAAPLLVDHRLVDPAGGVVVLLARSLVWVKRS